MLGLTNTVKQARAEALLAKLDAAVTGGKLEIYATARPATGGAPGAAALATIQLNKPAGTVSGAGTLTITPPAQSTQIVNTGAPVWARFTDGDGVALIDASAGIADADVIIDQETLYAGAFVTIISAQFPEGG